MYMMSIFFQISSTDFLEALKTNDTYGREFILRMISFRNGMETFIYLPPVSLNGLSLLGSIWSLAIVPNIRRYDDLKKYYFGSSYYY